MPQDPTSLPRYANPPVVETVLGVHFQPIERISIIDQCLFWSSISHEFPEVEERPTVDEVREHFGNDLWRPKGSRRWQIAATPPLRLWATSADGQHTIQIQKDALLTNWERNPEKSVPYLKFEERQRQFSERLSAYDAFVSKRDLGMIEPRGCMVRYINHIPLDASVDLAANIESIFTCWGNATSDGWLPMPDTLNLQFGFPMPDESGRLRVQITQVMRSSDDCPIIQFDLTARGKPKEATISSAMDWLQLGHEWIVRGFTSLTTTAMHDKWGHDK